MTQFTDKKNVSDVVIIVASAPIINHLVSWSIAVIVLIYSCLSNRDIGPLEWSD
jgi:hypothetical protein